MSKHNSTCVCLKLDCARQLDMLVNGYFFSFLHDVFSEKLQTKTSTLFLRVSVK